MARKQQMLKVLETAETGLAALAAEAAAQRAYADAAALLEAARRVQQIGEQTLTTPAEASPVAPRTPAADPLPAPARAARAATPTAAAATRKTRKADYPKFFREGDTLIKVGWSKSEGSEYEHKCPKRVLDALVATLLSIGGDGVIFATDQFLPLIDAAQTEVPIYQVYLGIALMKQVAIIDQHGRRGYSIPRLAHFREAVEAAWHNLPRR
jgi:hypothetical protein